MNRALKPGPWRKMWRDFWESFSRDPGKGYVGEDQMGNRFYEYDRSKRRGNVMRGYDPPPETLMPSPPPSVEWQAWLNNTRIFPPSEEEIYLNKLKQQAQLAQDAETEKRAPKIESKGIGAADMDKKQKWPTNFPMYKENEFEMQPGAKKQAESENKARKPEKDDQKKEG